MLSASGAGADDPLRITSISPTLDQGPIPFISSLEVTFNKAIDQTTFSPEDVAVVDLDRFKMTGVSAFDGMMYDTVAEGSLLYAATDAGLEIFDISDPSQVRQLGVYYADRSVGGFAVRGSVVYLADHQGLQIIDVSDPTAPVRLGGEAKLSNPYGIDVVGNTVYVADWGCRLRVFDASNPVAPRLLAEYGGGQSASSVRVVGNLAYLGEVEGKLEILDVSNPYAPVLLGEYLAPGPVGNVQLTGSLALLTIGRAPPQIVDVSNPPAPTFVGECPVVDCSHVELVGDVAYLCDSEGLLSICDISDPSAPQLLGSFDAENWVYGLGVADGRAYLSDWRDGLQILDVSNPTAPLLLGGYRATASVYDVRSRGGLLYVLDQNRGLEIRDVTDPAHPALLSTYTATSGFSAAFELAGNFAYVATGDGLDIVDISNPADPRRVGRYAPSLYYDPAAICVQGNAAYVVDDHFGLQIFDLSNPAAPQLLSSYPAGGWAGDVKVVGSMAYVMDVAAGLQIFDVSNPFAPTYAGSYRLPDYGLAVDVAGGLAFVGGQFNELQILDVSDPAHIELVGSYRTAGWVKAVHVVGSLAYVSDHGAGLRVLDISNPAAPRCLTVYILRGVPEAIGVSGEWIYLAAALYGVKVVRLGEPVAAVSPTGNNSYRIDLPQELPRGRYAVQIGPEIVDVYGNRLDQDADGRGGEDGDDLCFASFTVIGYSPTDIRLSATVAAENQPAGTVVGRFTTVDVDPGDTFTYSLVGGEGAGDNACFSIDEEGNLLTAASFDFETKSFYGIHVRTTDSMGFSYEKRFMITVGDAHDFDSAGLFDPQNSAFYLRESNSTGPADYTFGYGDPSQRWTEVVGDWDGDGNDGIGFFDPITSTWYLRDSLSAGYADWTLGYGNPQLTWGNRDRNWQPIVGDWDGDGTDTIGFFDPDTCLWYLRNSLSTGYADWTFAYGDPEQTTGHGDRNWQPIAGNWDGAGGDSIGFFDPGHCVWYLRNALSTGAADYTFGFGAPTLTCGHAADNWQPIIGDWEGNRTDTVGFFDPDGSVFMLRNSLTTGPAEFVFGYGVPGAHWRPLSGRWSVGEEFSSTDPNETPRAEAVDQIDLAELVSWEWNG